VISASALPRLLTCPGSVALPQARLANAYADEGADGHAEVEAALRSGDLSALPDQIRALVEGCTLEVERPLAYDVATGEARWLSAIGRDYGAAPFEIPGTPDLVAVGSDRVVVADWKLYQDIGAPSASSQLLLYALAVARIVGVEKVDLAVWYRGTGRVATVEVDVFDLDTFAVRLRTLHTRVAEQQRRVTSGTLPDVSEGPHCRHCPAINSCPAKVALLRRITSGEEASEAELMIPLDEHTAGEAYRRWRAAKHLMSHVERAIHAYAAERPIPIGDGKVYGPRRIQGNEKLDGDVVYQVVEALHGRPVADAAVVRNATKSRLKEALALAVDKGGAAKAERAVLAEVRKRGGVSTRETEKWEEYTLRLAASDS
jgi:hypothetical protein